VIFRVYFTLQMMKSWRKMCARDYFLLIEMASARLVTPLLYTVMYLVK